VYSGEIERHTPRESLLESGEWRKRATVSIRGVARRIEIVERQVTSASMTSTASAADSAPASR
jgi:hypothetical protein